MKNLKTVIYFVIFGFLFAAGFALWMQHEEEKAKAQIRFNEAMGRPLTTDL
jgi:predicted negative regulator of RcsB-dependent stress response